MTNSSAEAKGFFNVLVLCAGLSTRFGADKMLHGFGNSTIMETTVENALAARPNKIWVVSTEKRFRHCSLTDSFSGVVNHNPESGMMHSLGLGLLAMLQEAEHIGTTAIVLGDMPYVQPYTYRQMFHAMHMYRQNVLVPRYSGRPGHPVLLSTGMTRKLAAFCMDCRTSCRNTGSMVIRDWLYSGAVFVDLDDPGIIRDIDCHEDL